MCVYVTERCETTEGNSRKGCSYPTRSIYHSEYPLCRNQSNRLTRHSLLKLMADDSKSKLIISHSLIYSATHEQHRQWPQPAEVIHLMEPLSSTQICQWTDTDPILSAVRRRVQDGWSEQDEKTKGLLPYMRRGYELSCEGCVLWGSRVVIPSKGRSCALTMLHETHPGIEIPGLGIYVVALDG